MTMIERVVRAITSVEPVWSRRNDMRNDSLYWEACYHSDPEVVRPVVIKAFATADEADAFAEVETERRRARAAIEAMREPDEAMIDAADNLYGVTRHVAARIFHAMIAAALGEGRDG